MIDGYRPVNATDLNVGDVVIVERRKYDYKTGRPVPSEYYRAIVGEHNTVAGPMKHIVNEPTIEWPQIAPWAGKWIYASNDSVTQMWKE